MVKKTEYTPSGRPKVGWPDATNMDEDAYYKALFRLQDEVGLGFREARAVLMPQQLLHGLAEEWGCTKENVYNLVRRGYSKIEKYTGGDEDLEAKLVPADLSYVM